VTPGLLNPAMERIEISGWRGAEAISSTCKYT